jgi:hypothetical protein
LAGISTETLDSENCHFEQFQIIICSKSEKARKKCFLTKTDFKAKIGTPQLWGIKNNFFEHFQIMTKL